MAECDVPRNDRSICQFCGASVPPINGKGTCPKCNPAQIGVEPITIAERVNLEAMPVGIAVLATLDARKDATEDYRRACTQAVPKYEAALKESERSCELYKAMKEGVAIRIHDLEGTLQIRDADYQSACEDRAALEQQLKEAKEASDAFETSMCQLAEELSEAKADLHSCPVCGMKCKDCMCVENKLSYLKVLADEMESEARRVDHTGRPLSNAPLILEYAERLKQILAGDKPNASDV